MKRAVLYTLLLLMAKRSCAFAPAAAIKPYKAIASMDDLKYVPCTPRTLPALAVTGHQYHDYDPDYNKSWLEKGVDKINDMLPWGSKDKKTRWAKRERLRQRKAVGKEMKQLLRPLPLPFRVMGNMMASGTDIVIQKEGQKIEKYLMQSQRLLNADEGTGQLLGKPIVVGNVISQNSSTVIINGKKSVRIQAVFEVLGAKENAVASMVSSQRSVESLEIKSASGVRYKVK